MSRMLDTALVTVKNTANITDPLVWIVKVQLSDTESINLARYDTTITTYEGTSAPYTATVYTPFPWEFDAIQQDQRGTLTDVEFKVSNVTRELIHLIESTDITGNLVRLRLVSSANLGDASNATPFFEDQKMYILDISEISFENITFNVGNFSLLRKRAPAKVYNRNRCRFAFGSAECGFPSSTTGTFTGAQDGFDVSTVSLTSCDLGFATPNGCKAHGALEKVAGIPVIHPRRFGGFPGVPKGPGY